MSTEAAQAPRVSLANGSKRYLLGKKGAQKIGLIWSVQICGEIPAVSPGKRKRDTFNVGLQRRLRLLGSRIIVCRIQEEMFQLVILEKRLLCLYLGKMSSVFVLF